jgi:hypothetical protein
MLIERLPVDALHPAPYNPRVPLTSGDAAYQRLSRSLAEFGLVQPIVWNRQTGHVVAGHQRLEVLKQQGCREVDCVIVDLPLEREQALNVTLNNPSVASDWDPDRLLTLIRELEELPEFDATLTGFDEQQLADLLLGPSPVPPQAWTALDDDPSSGLVQATLEIPPDRWDAVCGLLDGLLAAEPGVSLHVRLPRGSAPRDESSARQ